MGVKERKERERRQRISDILEAARRKFEAKGFINTTLQDVAHEAEISVGLIYRYFESKEDIFASLALKGAYQFDGELGPILDKGSSVTTRAGAMNVLFEIAQKFFDFYGPYGEYFDMLLYSYKGMKQVQIHGATMTELMSITLQSLDKLKNFIQDSPHFEAEDDDEALSVVFLLWGILLGCHKLFDANGRGHLFAFAFKQDKFLKHMIHEICHGIASSKRTPRSTLKKKTSKTIKDVENPPLVN